MAVYDVLPLELTDGVRSWKATPEVRLLTLLPGELSPSLRAILRVATLPDGYHPPSFSPLAYEKSNLAPSMYEALSYAWGDNIKSHSIRVKPGNKIEHLDELRTFLDHPTAINADDDAYSQLQITENLHIALKYLRLRDKPRVLWVDALCIDQANEPEKTQQVMIMDRIYAQADQVVVWLGEASSFQPARDSFDQKVREMSAAMKGVAIEELILEIDYDPPSMHHPVADQGKGGGLSTGQDQVASSESDFAFDVLEEARAGTLTSDRRESGREAVQRLLQRPWWTRGWVVQEVVMARECVFMCGYRSITWDTMGRGISAFDPFPSDGVTEWSVKGSEFWSPMLWMLKKNRGMSSMMQLPYLLAHLSNRSCSDPRDKIFSLTNMVAAGPGVRINYAKSTREVYIDAVQHCVLHKPNLSIITRHHTGYDPGKPNVLDLPSWVPDFSQSDGDGSLSWTVATDFYYRDLYFADGRFNTEGITRFRFLDPFRVPGMMFGQGFYLDRIQSIPEASRDDAANLSDGDNGSWETYTESSFSQNEFHGYIDDDESWASLVRGWEPPCVSGDETYVPTGESMLRAYWRTLVMDKYDRKWRYSSLSDKFAPGWRGDFCYKVWARQVMLSEFGSRLSQYVEKFGAMLRRATQGRRFAMTDNGCMALVPEAAAVGDIVVVLLGGSVPFILRDQSPPPSESEKERFCMIGTAYVHGWMDGELAKKHEAGVVEMDYFRIY